MARAYRRAIAVRQYFCPYCEVWDHTDNFTRRQLYSVDTEWSVDGGTYWGDYTSWEVWFHDSCEENAASPDENPSSRSEGEVWVCGDCKSEYEDQDDAAECCRD